MAPALTERVRSSEPSPIRQTFDLANREERAGRDPVRLEIGEPDLDTPAHVIEAPTEAARASRTHYTANAGLLDLRAAISETRAREYGLDADPDGEIVVTTGGMEALHLAALAVADPGSEVLIPTPAWPNYLTQKQPCG